MDHDAWVGLFTFIGMFILLILGVPIFICLLAATFVGFWLLQDPNMLLFQFTSGPYNVTSDFTFAVVPLFVLMSVLAADIGIARNAYDAASKWLGRLRGGLLMATVGSAAVFGAACGASIASAAVFTKTALPELDKCNYNKSLSTGCIAVAGNLASLIPPSVGIIIICLLIPDVPNIESPSIGRALVAGVIPGITLTILLMLVIQTIGFFKPSAMPKQDAEVSWQQRFVSLGQIVPILFIVLLVIGGMYAAWFPPTVGGAIGSVGVLIVASIQRLSWKVIAHSFYETVLINAQLFPLIIAGTLFSRFIAGSGLSNALLKLITDVNLHPMALMLVVIIFYLFIGCVLEFMSMAIITLPIVYPLLVGVGFDPTATVIILVLLSEIALITPPIGLSVFLISGVAKVPPETVFKGVVPFFATSAILLWLLVFFPEIATWLPNITYGAGQ